MSIVIAILENQKDTDFVVRYIRKFKGRVSVLNEEEVENQWMIKMIDEAEEEGGEVSEEEIMKILKENGAEI